MEAIVTISRWHHWDRVDDIVPQHVRNAFVGSQMKASGRRQGVRDSRFLIKDIACARQGVSDCCFLIKDIACSRQGVSDCRFLIKDIACSRAGVKGFFRCLRMWKPWYLCVLFHLYDTSTQADEELQAARDCSSWPAIPSNDREWNSVRTSSGRCSRYSSIARCSALSATVVIAGRIAARPFAR